MTADYQKVSQGAGWFPRTDYEVLALGGPDRVSFLNSYNSQDVKNLPSGRQAYGAVLTQKGKLVSDTRILHLPDKILLVVEPGYAQKILDHWKTFLMFANVEAVEETGRWCRFAVFGPRAGDLIAAWLGQDPPADPGILFMQDVNGAPAYVAAALGSGVPGWEVFAPAAARDTIAQEWREKGAALGIEAVNPAVLETFRVEAALPKMGVDMGDDNLVAEVGLDKNAASFNKGCYLGQETTARVNSQGHVNRGLVRFQLARPYPGALPAEIFAGDKAVGRLTSLVDSPRFSATIGLALVHRAAREAGEAPHLKGPDGPIELTQVE